MDVSLARTFDTDLIREILIQPDIWERISDGVAPEDYYPSCDANNCWLVVTIDLDIAGIIYLNVDTSCALSFHPYLREKYRMHGREMVNKFFKWFIDEVPDSHNKVNVVIPACFKSTVNFARKTGFIQEGLCRDSYRKDGKIYDRIMFGLTRTEIEGLIWAA